ncbi:MAG: hypothetical protein ACR2LZ_05615 [Pyrinomonadaceae bacterium]
MSHEISEQSRELFQLVVEKVEDFAVYAKDLGGYCQLNEMVRHDGKSYDIICR